MSPETARHSRPEVSNEERYRALLHSVSTFVWVADAGGQFSVPQPGWEKYTGHGFDQHGGTGWISDVHPDDRAHVGEVWNQALQSKSWYEVAWRCWHGASQSWRQCITRGVPVTDQAGFVREWIGAVLDIEDRVDFELKRTQNDLARVNRELALNLETMTRLHQLSTRLVQAGELSVLLGEIIATALDLTGADKGNIQLLQNGMLRIIEHRGFDTAFLDYFNNVEPGKAVCGMALEQKGRVIVESVAGSPIFAGTPALDVLLAAGVRAVQSTPLFSLSGRLLGMFSTHYSMPQVPPERDLRILDILARQAADLIERKMAEQTRRQAQETLNLSLKAGRAGTFDWDAQKDRNRWSDQLLELYGIRREEFGESTRDWQAALFPEDRERAIAAMERSLESGEFEVDFRIVRRDNGQVRWMHGAGQVFFEDGKPARMVGINVDITDQKRADEELRRLNRDLEQFAYSVSHDLQEPLRSVQIYSEMLAAAGSEKLEGKALDALNFVRTGAARLEQLLRDLLVYTQASRFETSAEPTDAGECLAAAVQNLAGTISESGAKIDAGALPTVRVHATQLRQVFQNVVGNAIKYGKPGVPPAVRVRAERQNEQWRFAVADNGIGIDPEYHQRIFGLFKRLHTQHEYNGTGIGLALCRRIVEHYHGRIWVESRPGEGSTFYFTLPA